MVELIKQHLEQHPDLGGLREFAKRAGVSYHSMQKYAKGANLPPPDKWILIRDEIRRAGPGRSAPLLFDRTGIKKEGDIMDPADLPRSASLDSETKPRPDVPAEDMAPNGERASRREDRQEFYIPIHGFVWLYPEEVDIVDHPAFQRLSGMHQLGMAYLVFRGATHRRFEHALGTVSVAQRMLEAISHNCAKRPRRSIDLKDQWVIGCKPSPAEERFIRLGALLHDIGHMPFGHTFEDELHVLNKHDETARIEKILTKTNWAAHSDAVGADKGAIKSHKEETLHERINRLYAKYVPKGLRKFDAATLLKQIIIKPDKGESALDKEKRQAEETFSASQHLRIDICRDIVGNTICADLLDYLHRDWYHVGKQRYFDERIFHYMEIRTPVENRSLALHSEPPPTDKDAFVIAIGNWPSLRSDGITSILELLESRYQLAEAVLFHRTKMTATAMLERTLSLAFLPQGSGSSKENSIDLEERLLDDAEELLLPSILSGAAFVSDTKPSDDEAKRRRHSRSLASKILRRELHELLLMMAFDQMEMRDRDYIQNLYADGKEAPSNRARALCTLEEDFGLHSGAITMYCPESRMNNKIAQVRIFVENTVSHFDAYEKEHGDILSAGHLNAQLNRFKRLWRIGFFIDPAVRKEKGEQFISLLIKAIRTQVLLLHNREDSIESVVADIARNVVQIPTFHLHGKKALLDPKPMKIARTGSASATEEYPTRAPSLLRFISG